MAAESVVLRLDDQRVEEYTSKGWTAVARSWAAELAAPDVDVLTEHIESLDGAVTIRALGRVDVPAILHLDADTIADYPVDVATRHERLDAAGATPTDVRRAFGAITPDGRLVGMTFLDLDSDHAETDFTVVARDWSGRGIGTAIKAASLLALRAEGVSRFRTGGAAENASILAANLALGYRVDEEWVTLRSPS